MRSVNTAMFIDREISTDYKISTDNKVLVQIEKIREAQDEISRALNDMELKVGTIKFENKAGTYETALIVDEEILDECCEKICANTGSVKEAYGRLIEMGVFTKKSRKSRL